MSAATIKCAKLGADLPAIDPNSPEGERNLKMVKLIAGSQFAQRVLQNISAKAMGMWNDHMLMVINEYRLDPTSDEANTILAKHMDAFFFGERAEIPNYVPPKR